MPERRRKRPKDLVEDVLRNAGRDDVYQKRRACFPTLAGMGGLPETMADIVHDDPPWYCHGLALRFATYPDCRDLVFQRWNDLLCRASQAPGWAEEYRNWSNKKSHWARRWDRFFQFLWMLQCVEYFSERGGRVRFPASRNGPAPDLCVDLEDGSSLYVECYFYTKWWSCEAFLEELLTRLDTRLSIQRTENIAIADNLLVQGKPVRYAREMLAFRRALDAERLNGLRIKAERVSPQHVCNLGPISIWLRGGGRYQSKDNAHGSPAESLPVYVNEIIGKKANSNGLEEHRPNLVMANGLGPDYQSSLREARSEQFDLPTSLDGVAIFACGVDQQVQSQDGIWLRRPNHTL